MNISSQIKDALALTRPGQWPILSAQFAVGALLVSPRALSGGCWVNINSLLVLFIAWVCWVVLLNGGTLAYNSAFDKDDGPVAYLSDPPEPPSWLAWASTVFMLLGAVLGWLVVGKAFGLVILACVILSLLYSGSWTRFKSVPGLDLLVNMVGYGAGTTMAGLLAGRAAYLQTGVGCPVGASRWALDLGSIWPATRGDISQQIVEATANEASWIVLGFALLFGSLYPLTQLYQLEDDKRRGDRTLATALGPARSIGLAVMLGVLSSVAFGLCIIGRGGGLLWPLFAATLAIWIIHLFIWMLKEPGRPAAEREQGMYRALTIWALVDIGLVLWVIF